MIDPVPEIQSMATLLARANLCRMRGSWDAAVEACMDALCIEPDNVAAHSLLGDIYADQNKLDDAIQWYCIALDLKPDSLADRSKLLRAVEDRKHELAESPRKVATVIENITAAWQLKSAGRSARSERAVRAGIFVAALLMLTAIVAAPLVIQYRKQSQQAFAYTNTPANNIIDTPAVVLPHLPGGPDTDTSTTTVASLLAADPFDQTLLTHLRANSDLKSRGIEAVGVESDPRTARVELTFVCTPDAASQAAPRGAILRGAIRLAQAAYADAQPNQITAFTVRALCILPTPAASPAGAAASQPPAASQPRLAFMGDLASSDLSDSEPSTDADAENRFTSPWWAEGIR